MIAAFEWRFPILSGTGASNTPVPPVYTTAHPGEYQDGPPLIGEHNEEIYCGELGLQRTELAYLAESGVV